MLAEDNKTFCADLTTLSGRVNEAFVAEAIGSDHLPTVLDILLWVHRVLRVDSGWLALTSSLVLLSAGAPHVLRGHRCDTMFGTILSIQSGKEAACQIHWGFAVIAMLGYHMVASYFRVLTPLLQQFTFPNRPWDCHALNDLQSQWLFLRFVMLNHLISFSTFVNMSITFYRFVMILLKSHIVVSLLILHDPFEEPAWGCLGFEPQDLIQFSDEFHGFFQLTLSRHRKMEQDKLKHVS